MGYYINTTMDGQSLGRINKANSLILTSGAVSIPQPKSFAEVPPDKALVCVVSNGPFEAAGYCFSEREFEAFTVPTDCRIKQWLLMPKTLVEKLTGYDMKEA